MIVISVSRDFSPTPGARYRVDGPCSGQEFREDHIEPLFGSSADESLIEIRLDGVEGYATSFLEEAFGGLVRLFGLSRCRNRLRFVSEEDPELLEEIGGYMEGAEKGGANEA